MFSCAIRPVKADLTKRRPAIWCHGPRLIQIQWTTMVDADGYVGASAALRPLQQRDWLKDAYFDFKQLAASTFRFSFTLRLT